MRKHAQFVVALCAVVFGFFAREASAVGGHDPGNGATRSEMVSAALARPELQAVGTIVSTLTDGSDARSTINLIDSHWGVMTAHQNRNGAHNHRVQFVSNYLTAPESSVITNMQVFEHPLFTGSTQTSKDLALVYFPDGVAGVTPASLYAGSLAVGQMTYGVGFSSPAMPSTGQTTDDGFMALMINRIERIGYPQLGTSNDFAVTRFAQPSFSGYNYFGGFSWIGDSGGGYWVDVNGQLQLAAIISHGYGAPDYFSASAAFMLSNDDGFIANRSSLIPEPSSLVLILGFLGAALWRSGRI